MFYVFVIQTTSLQEKVTASFAYETYRNAEKKFFEELAYDLDGRKGCVVMIINDNGIVLKQDSWASAE